MSQVVFDPSKASANTSATRVPARVMTDAELSVIFIPNASTNPKAPAGRAIVKTQACVYEITLFHNGAQLGMSASRDYLSASIPFDLQSAILERCEAQAAAAVDVTVTNCVFSKFAVPRGAQKGFLMMELLNQGKIWSIRYGIATKTGKPYIMESEIFKKPADEAATAAATKPAEDGQILNGHYRVNVKPAADGVAEQVTITKSDIRAGGVTLSPELYQLALDQVTRELIRLGMLASDTPVSSVEVENAETGLRDVVMSV